MEVVVRLDRHNGKWVGMALELDMWGPTRTPSKRGQGKETYALPDIRVLLLRGLNGRRLSADTSDGMSSHGPHTSVCIGICAGWASGGAASSGSGGMYPTGARTGASTPSGWAAQRSRFIALQRLSRVLYLILSSHAIQSADRGGGRRPALALGSRRYIVLASPAGVWSLSIL